MYDSEPLNFLALNPLPALIVNVGTDRITDVNDAGAELFGCDLFEVSFSTLTDCGVSNLRLFIEAILHYGSYTDQQITFQRPDGTALRLQTFGSHLLEMPNNIMFSFLDLDLQDARSERAAQESHQRAGLMQWQNIYGFFQEIEAQNHLILEAAGEGIYGINAEGKTTFINRAAQEMLGWNAEDLIGNDLHSIIHHKHLCGDSFPAHTCPIYHSFRKEETVRIDDDAFWRKDGKPILVEYVSTPIYDRGVLAGAVVIFRDVTERKQSEKELTEALATVEALQEKLEQENAYLLNEIKTVRSHAGIIGQSKAVQNLTSQIDLVAHSKNNVLITGPTGTGKTLTVAAIHEARNEAKRPLIRVNCSDVPLRELEAEVFGYRKGAFRGAALDSVGKLALAQNGILHLDEVANLPKEFQAKLVTVIQARAYRRLGETTDKSVDVTIISTTSRDLTAEVKAGRFRQDLFFELNVFPMHCAALRDRPEDIPYLARHFLDLVQKRSQLDKIKLTKANIADLQAYKWPGNVRELQNVIERAAILSQNGKLSFDFKSSAPMGGEQDETILSQAELRELERDNLLRCLKRTKGKVSGSNGTARLLGLPATTVYSRIKSFGLSPKDWTV